MKKLLIVTMLSLATAAFADCQNGKFASPRQGEAAVNSRCIYTINQDFFSLKQDKSLYNFWEQLRTDYRNSVKNRDFVIINSSTKEAYHLAAGNLYLDGIGNGTAANNYDFKDLTGNNEYPQLNNKNKVVNLNKIFSAFGKNYIITAADKKTTSLNIPAVQDNLLAMITAIPEAAKFQAVAGGVYSDNVTAAWDQSYKPIVTNWQKTLTYKGLAVGTPLRMQDTLDYLNTLQNKSDLNLVTYNVACPVFKIGCPVVGATQLFY